MNTDHYNEEDFNKFLRGLVNTERLDDPASGITLQVIDKGVSSLSSKQLYHFEVALANFVTDECALCGNDIPWCEMSGAEDNGGYCSWCAHHLD